MANQEHLRIFNQGVEVWNKWRENNPEIKPDLSEEHLTHLTDTDLSFVNLSRTNLSGSSINRAKLFKANLKHANLANVKLMGAEIIETDLTGANLMGAWLRAALFSDGVINTRIIKSDFGGANLSRAMLLGAKIERTKFNDSTFAGADLDRVELIDSELINANMVRCRFIETNLEGTVLKECRVFGISTWALKGKPKEQLNLIITKGNEPKITVDNLEVAQFIYLLLNNPKIRDVIDTIAKKAVLILGSFKEERKTVLDAIRKELRRRDYLPIMFDFEKPAHRNIGETVSTLAHMSKFIIADITDAKSITAELERIVFKLPSVPVQPLILSSEEEYGMFDSIKCCKQVLETYRYDNQEMLLANLKEHVIDPAEAKARELVPLAANQ